MNILLIYAYPNRNSFNSRILKTVEKNLPVTNKVRILDLYAEDFNPVLYFDEKKRRRDMQFDPDTESHRQDLIWADHLIFIFPIWWSSMPAILKGYIDRVFSTGFAYKFDGLMPTKLLKGKSATIITTHDTPGLYVKFFLNDYGKILEKQTLGMVGIKTSKTLTMPFLRNSSEKQREKFIKKVIKHIKKIGQ